MLVCVVDMGKGAEVGSRHGFVAYRPAAIPHSVWEPYCCCARCAIEVEAPAHKAISAGRWWAAKSQGC
jgi:hypothetical protein